MRPVRLIGRVYIYTILKKYESHWVLYLVFLSLHYTYLTPKIVVSGTAISRPSKRGVEDSNSCIIMKPWFPN